MAQRIHHHTFKNGLTLLVERMTHVRSAAVNFLFPAGNVYDPPGQVGIGSFLVEMMTRGAGERNSRELALALDNLGLDRHESVSQMHMRFWGSTLSRNLPAALEIYADIIRRPHLPADEIEAVRALSLQELQGLVDDYRGRCFVELRKRHWPHPLGQDQRGTVKTLNAINAVRVRDHYEHLLGPNEGMITIAGDVDFASLRDQIERLFGDWKGIQDCTYELLPAKGGQGHITCDTEQTQIAIAYPSVPAAHPDYFQALAAVQVLSGGMGARLFTEVREKRGLCYSVSAAHRTFKDIACVMCHAGTRNDRAQETLDVTLQELRRIEEGISQEEVDRVKVGLKTSLIMQGESTSARAGALASDWYFLGRVRSLEEIQEQVEALTPDSIVAHLRRCPARDFTIATLGPDKLRVKKSLPGSTAKK